MMMLVKAGSFVKQCSLPIIWLAVRNYFIDFLIQNQMESSKFKIPVISKVISQTARNISQAPSSFIFELTTAVGTHTLCGMASITERVRPFISLHILWLVFVMGRN